MTAMLGLVLAWSLAAHDASTLCELRQRRSARPRHALELTLRATPDSLPEINRSTESEVGHRQRLPWDTATVYAQIFEVVQIDGDLGQLRGRSYPRVAVVWWRLGLQCQRMTPRYAVRSDVSELFLPALAVDRRDTLSEAFGAIVADLRPEHQWIGEIPTIDVSQGAWIYSPSEQRPVNLPQTVQGALTVSEYRALFARLPVVGASSSEWQRSWRELLSWGDADQRRWTRYPAAGELCLAAMNVGDSVRTRRCR